SDSNSDFPPSPRSTTASQPGSRPVSPHGSQLQTPEEPTDRPVRTKIPTWRKLEGLASKSLVAHTGPSLHSSSPHYIASYAPPEEPHTLQKLWAPHMHHNGLPLSSKSSAPLIDMAHTLSYPVLIIERLLDPN